MSGNWNFERRPRRANAVQWDDNNTLEVMTLLGNHGMVGECFLHSDGKCYLTIRKNGWITFTMRRGDSAFTGEDGLLRFASEETFRSKYQPINGELERLRAFAREILAEGMDNLSVLNIGVRHRLLVPRECGLALDLADSLKAAV